MVNVYRLITRHTIEEKIMGLQKFKIRTANTVISSDNASLSSMATDSVFDLFSLDEEAKGAAIEGQGQGHGSKVAEESAGKTSLKALLEEMPELWDDRQYEQEYNMQNYVNKTKKQ